VNDPCGQVKSPRRTVKQNSGQDDSVNGGDYEPAEDWDNTASSVKVIQCFTHGSTCSKRRIHASHFAPMGLKDYCGQKKPKSHVTAFIQNYENQTKPESNLSAVCGDAARRGASSVHFHDQ
jgi:hypothetical protein